jgi:hypothetical protein
MHAYQWYYTPQREVWVHARIIRRIGYTPYMGGPCPPQPPPLYIIIKVTVNEPPKNFLSNFRGVELLLTNSIELKEKTCPVPVVTVVLYLVPAPQ